MEIDETIRLRPKKLHGLCWVHAERSIRKLSGFTQDQRKALDDTRKDIWDLYCSLKIYRQNPTEAENKILENRFDELFTRNTGFALLDQALKRIHENKSELLQVLKKPDILLHDNLSESEIREYVKRTKISGSTHSDSGEECRGTFTRLKMTCRKLGFSFWEFLLDREYRKNLIPPIPDIMGSQMAPNAP